MRKKILSIISIVTMIFFVACSNEDIVKDAANDTPDASRVLSFTASMPSEPTPRVALEENADKYIDLSWEAGDEIKFAFVQGETIANATSTVTSISNGGKTAQFAVTLPEGINNTEEFTLFGVYGGGVVSGTDVTLPANPGNTTSLANIDLMLYFKQIVTPGEELAVTFNHLGSLFSINLKNSHSTQLSYTGIEFRLVGVGGDAKWAYNNAEGGQAFDLATEKFKNTETAGNFISFKVPNSTVVPAGGIIKLWGWYPTLANKNWPELKLELFNNGAPHKEGSNFKAARTSPTAVGRNFSFYVVYNGADYKFSDESFTPLITQKEVVLDVPKMGTLGTLLAEYDKAYIEKLTLTGKINAADFEFMKTQLPNLSYLDMLEVKCDKNEIPQYAFGRDAGTDFTAPHINLITVILPESITIIGKAAFAKCESLTTVLNWPETLIQIMNLAFRDTPLTGVLEFKSTEGLALGGRAFSGCVNLTGMDFSTMTKYSSIAGNVFENCTGLTGRITFGLPQSQIAKDAFNGCSSDLTFRIPRNDVIKYNAHPFPEHSTVEVKESLLPDYQADAGWGSGHVKLVEYTE